MRVPTVDSRSIPGVRIRWHSSSEREAAAGVWKALETRVGGDALACSWDWTEVWLEHYGDLVPHRFAVGEIDGVACGITLVTRSVGRRRGPFRVRSVHLGTAGEPPGDSVFVEYNRTLVAPDLRRDFAAALIDELRDEGDWHELVIDGFAPEEAEPYLLAEPLLVPRRMICPVMDLRVVGSGDGDGTVLAALKYPVRKKIRRSLKALGEVETEWARTPDHALDILTELTELHQRRWTAVGEPGAFASERFAGFHRDLVPRLLPGGGVILFRVRASAGTVGCLYAFVERSRVLAYQTGFASFPDRMIRPGFVVLAACMQECFEQGLIEFDHQVGDTRYKRELSTTTRELVWATGRRPRLRWRLMDGLAAAKRKLGRDSGFGHEPGAEQLTEGP